MWKKSEHDPQSPQPTYNPSDSVEQLKHRAVLGVSITVKGDISGEEDLMVQGRVEGKIDLKKFNVTIGQKGRVKADVYAKVISVEGQVEGNLFGEEKIIIRKSGRVKGNLVAPRVSLEEGSNFKGSIDMDTSKALPKQEPHARPIKVSEEPDKRKGTSAEKLEKVPLGFGSETADPAAKGR